MAKKRNFADDGWAVWIDGDDTSTIYLNEWMNPRKKSYVDVGIRIRGFFQSWKLSIYVPFRVEPDEVEDISEKLQDRDILCGIFSASCWIDYKKNAYASEIAYNGKTIDLLHIARAGYEVSSLAEGTLIVLDLEHLHSYADNDEVYLLLRLPHKSLDEVFKSNTTVTAHLEKLRDLVTTPILSERYGYSVRVNEARMLPKEITCIGAFHRQKLKKTVVSISLDDSFELNDGNCYRIRRLEENLYRDYVPEGFACENNITYQWQQTKEENLRGHFNFYFDISREAVSQVSMLIYMILLMVIGIVGGALWDLIKFIAFGLL